MQECLSGPASYDPLNSSLRDGFLVEVYIMFDLVYVMYSIELCEPSKALSRPRLCCADTKAAVLCCHCGVTAYSTCCAQCRAV